MTVPILASGTRATAADAAEKAYAYKLDFSGLKGTGLAKILRNHSDLERLKSEEPGSIWELRSRIRRDLTAFATIMRAEGYYGARLDYDLLRREKPIVVRIDVRPGTRFTVETYAIEFLHADRLPETVLKAAGDRASGMTGKPARNEDIAEAYQAVLRLLPDQGYPRAEMTDRRVEADHADSGVEVRVVIDPGPLVRFGPVVIEGLTSVREGVVRKEVPWKEGDVFDQDKVQEFRQALAARNLFASIGINTDGELVDGDRVPVLVRLTEADHRTIGVGATFSTSKGFGGEVFWEHRNFRGRGEILYIDLKGNEQKQSGQVAFTKPGFLRKDQKLLLGVEGFRDDTEAFREYGGVVDGGVERELNSKWKVRLGGEFSYTEIRDQLTANDFLLVGTPASVWYDGSNDLLNPTRGYRMSARVVPYMTLTGGSGFFTTVDLTASAYFPLDSDDTYVVALRSHTGFLFGERTQNIPASKRFYAGGGGSVRGYAYQEVGPLDAEGDPLGGRSLFEVGAELRIRISKSWGIVPFIEGGNVFDSSYPDFSKKLRWGAGLGIRYYTAFGPIRLDVATPINPRPVDSDFQIYVSIGQSF